MYLHGGDEGMRRLSAMSTTHLEGWSTTMRRPSALATFSTLRVQNNGDIRQAAAISWQQTAATASNRQPGASLPSAPWRRFATRHLRADLDVFRVLEVLAHSLRLDISSFIKSHSLLILSATIPRCRAGFCIPWFGKSDRQMGHCV